MDEKIIKPDAVPPKVLVSSPKVLKREVYEAGREAQDVVAVAQQKARQILEEAERSREAILAQARQDGYAQGLAEWNDLLLRSRQREDELAKSWEDSMLRLSVRVAEKIIGHELKADPETIVDIVREALSSTRSGRHLVIQVNESDVDTVRSRIDNLKQIAVTGDIEVVASASVPTGGCSIESELGIIDARLETQLKCLEDILVRGVAAD
jgi:type III secretion protein L